MLFVRVSDETRDFENYEKIEKPLHMRLRSLPSEFGPHKNMSKFKYKKNYLNLGYLTWDILIKVFLIFDILI